MGLLTKPIKTLDDLFVHTLKDIYYAEQQITKALPKMSKKVTDPQLKQAFETHLQETRNQITRLEQVFKLHGEEVKAVDCPAIDGIIEEAEETASEVDVAPGRRDGHGAALRGLGDDADDPEHHPVREHQQGVPVEGQHGRDRHGHRHADEREQDDPHRPRRGLGERQWDDGHGQQGRRARPERGDHGRSHDRRQRRRDDVDRDERPAVLNAPAASDVRQTWL